jgi:hypothetical protein
MNIAPHEEGKPSFCPNLNLPFLPLTRRLAFREFPDYP